MRKIFFTTNTGNKKLSGVAIMKDGKVRKVVRF